MEQLLADWFSRLSMIILVKDWSNRQIFCASDDCVIDHVAIA